MKARNLSALRGVVLCVAFIAAGAMAGERSSPNYTITKDVLSGGGGAGASPQYRLHSTVGQSSPTDSLSSVNYTIQGGFFSGLRPEAGDVEGDLDGDGDVDRDDIMVVIGERNVAVEESECGAPCDLDGDGVITVLDGRKLVLLCTRPGCATQ